MADVSVRPARPQDAERVARLQLATWREAYADLLPAEALAVPEVEVAAVWLKAIEAPPTRLHRVLVAMDADELVGFAATQPASDDDLAPGTVELATLVVQPRWGRRGHGSRLLAAAVDLWRQDGATVATSWVVEADHVMTSFLQAAGWDYDGLGRTLDTGPDTGPPTGPGNGVRVITQRRLHTTVTS